ncbi:MAG TPA: hypothetical protein VFX15_02030 [Actinomycetes bacterium]|nr:hypothetical protein [Actinomycetes bacterium]
MKYDLTRLGVSPSAAATFGSVADVRPRTGGVDVDGSPAWSPPE